ncbi:thiopurine S-methyltransferase [Shewanella intestini]|uniref:Thiopurine S-methyltransferase n=1 Tax=Shewanella intestini TaxID=2017544 RepID=A0ABS5I0P7_9GAMM|nr:MULTISPECIES: thiopurine S-methyltransferase [Shewanella]MBR9727603.1 thiopurine S-methyltransferase [Shewanella intestini]MRG35247.1 thiopurine S-methyltransferase [Shewanella sp. XMDDZSB0408]
MEPSFWHNKWDQQQIGFHQPQVNPYLIEYWPQLNIPSSSTVFVPLCGKTLDMCFLAEQGHQVLGCELSAAAVEQFFSDNQLTVTKQSMGEHHAYQSEQVQLIQGDIFTLDASLTADIGAFYDRAALIAWPESMRAQYAEKLAQLIPAGISGLLVALDYPQGALQGPPFAVSTQWMTSYLAPLFEIELLKCDDVLADNPRFLNKNVPWLNEATYKLTRK